VLTLRVMPTHVDLLAPYVPPHEMHLLDALGRGRRHHKSVIGRIGEGATSLAGHRNRHQTRFAGSVNCSDDVFGRAAGRHRPEHVAYPSEGTHTAFEDGVVAVVIAQCSQRAGTVGQRQASQRLPIEDTTAHELSRQVGRNRRTAAVAGKQDPPAPGERSRDGLSRLRYGTGQKRIGESDRKGGPLSRLVDHYITHQACLLHVVTPFLLKLNSDTVSPILMRLSATRWRRSNSQQNSI